MVDRSESKILNSATPISEIATEILGFESSISTLKTAIEKREKDMSERFLGEKLIEGVWPRDRFANAMLKDKAS